MKKGIVMERHRNYTILMTKDGLFEKGIIQAEDSVIGEETAYEPYIEKKSSFRSFSAVRRKPSVKMLALACVIALVMLPFLLSTSQHKAYAYVTIDINPSLEIEIDSDLKVNKVQALNEDAAVLLEKLKALEGKGIQKALHTIIHSTEADGMVNPDKNMIVGISYFEAKGEIFPDGLEKYLANLNDWQVATLVIPEKIREQAEYDNISMNKLMAKKTAESSAETDLDKNDIEIINTFYNEETSSEETTVPVPVPAKEKTKEQDEPPAANKQKESADVEKEGNDAKVNNEGSEKEKKPAEKQKPTEKQKQVKQPEEKRKAENVKREKAQEQKKEAKEQRKQKQQEEKRQGPQKEKKEKTTGSPNKHRIPGQEKKDKDHPGKQHETHSKQKEKPAHPSNNGKGHGPDKKEKNNHGQGNNGKHNKNENKQHGNNGNGNGNH